MPITPFCGPFWVSRCRETEENMKNQGGGIKTKKQKKTKCQDLTSTHLLGVWLFGAFFIVKLGIFLRFLTQAHPPGGVGAIYIYACKNKKLSLMQSACPGPFPNKNRPSKVYKMWMRTKPVMQQHSTLFLSEGLFDT